MSKRAYLRAALLELLEEHQRDGMLPTSNRFLFYELVQRGIVPKHSKNKRRADQDMNEALTELRESGQVPWDWIVDETRFLENHTGWPSIKDGLENLVDTIRLDPWAGCEPLILTESRSLAGVLREICEEYCVQIASTNGQVGGFLHTKIGPMLRSGHNIFYLGDLDLAGGDIEANTKRVLEQKTELLFWERLALTEEQVDQYNLPVITKHDRRFNDGGAHEAVETEALSQAFIVEIVRNRLDAHLRFIPETLESVREREGMERTQIMITTKDEK